MIVSTDAARGVRHTWVCPTAFVIVLTGSSSETLAQHRLILTGWRMINILLVGGMHYQQVELEWTSATATKLISSQELQSTDINLLSRTVVNSHQFMF